MNPVVEQIKARLSIADVLGTYISLQPAGTQFKAKCPFHNERTASFSISPERGAYYCFGCGAKGDIFSFVQEFEGVDFKGALKILADRAGVPLTSYNAEKTESADPVFSALENATVQYEQELSKHADALAYLAKRGVTPETVKEFRIGYAPNEWRFLSNSASIGEQNAMERAGLSKKTDKGFYDRFRGRIMFPLCDSSGRVVGFSGRLFPEEIKREDVAPSPKYLNSPETEVFQKSRILFGFDKAKFHIKRNNFAILVEGQMDLVLSHQAGFKNTVATSGTAVSDTAALDASAQLQVISRLTPNLFLAFDGDSAGEKALARAAQVALTLGMNPKVVSLPIGVDPADFILAQGGDAWKEQLKHAQHFLLHRAGIVRRDAQTPHAMSALIRQEVFPFLVRVQSPIEQKLHLDAIAQEAGIGVRELVDELAQYKNDMQGSVQMPNSGTPSKARIPSLVLTLHERFIALTEQYAGESMEKYKRSLEELRFEDQQFSMPMVNPERIEHAKLLIEREYSGEDDEFRTKIAEELLQKISAEFFASLRLLYTAQLIQLEKQGNEEEVSRVMAYLQKLNQQKHTV